MKKLITAAIAFTLSMATTANALPVCYSMTEDGSITDLSHMCPASEQPVTIAARRSPELPAVEVATESPKATFQVRRINRTNWTATGTVNFSRAAEPGDRVVPYLQYEDGREVSLPAVTYERGNRRTEITFNVVPGTSTSEIEGGVR